MRPLRRPVTFLVACLEVALFAGQLTTLSSTYWTSWDLKINWTQSLGDIAGKKPHSDGQVISEGHAGLWSRCIRVHGTGKDFNETKLNADKCLSIFADWEQWDNLKYGKTCKLATACLCVIELLLTCILLALIAATFFRYPLKRRRCLNVSSGCVLVLQGVLIVLIPVFYVAGNMAELVEQLTSTYRLLMVVFMDAWYIHDWAYWLQVSLTVLWVVSACLFGYAQYGEGQRRTNRTSSITANGAKSLELPEMESLHVTVPSGK